MKPISLYAQMVGRAERPQLNTLENAAAARRELEALIQERDRLKAALLRIRDYPVHSEPMGGALDMQDIAYNALEGRAQ